MFRPPESHNQDDFPIKTIVQFAERKLTYVNTLKLYKLKRVTKSQEHVTISFWQGFLKNIGMCGNSDCPYDLRCLCTQSFCFMVVFKNCTVCQQNCCEIRSLCSYGTYLRRDVLLHLLLFINNFNLHNLTRRAFLCLLILLCKIVDGEILQTKAYRG